MQHILCCGSVKTKKTLQQTREQVETTLGRRLQMSDDQIFDFSKRFESKAINHRLSFQNYKDSLGLLGQDSLSFLADRMFSTMDPHKNGYITLDVYLDYIDVMLYGSEEKKLYQSFQLLDLQGRGTIKFNDFKIIVQSFAQMWSAALGQPMPLNLRYFADVFNQIACGKASFDFQDFKRHMKQHPDSLAWFTQPSKVLKQRINDYVSQKQLEKQLILDKIESLRESVQAQVHSGQVNICAALDVIDKRYLGNAENVLLGQQVAGCAVNVGQTTTNVHVQGDRGVSNHNPANNQAQNGSQNINNMTAQKDIFKSPIIQSQGVGGQEDLAAPGAQNSSQQGVQDNQNQPLQSLLIIGETPNPDDEETHRAEFSKKSPEYFGKRVSPAFLQRKNSEKMIKNSSRSPRKVSNKNQSSKQLQSKTIPPHTLEQQWSQVPSQPKQIVYPEQPQAVSEMPDYVSSFGRPSHLQNLSSIPRTSSFLRQNGHKPRDPLRIASHNVILQNRPENEKIQIIGEISSQKAADDQLQLEQEWLNRRIRELGERQQQQTQAPQSLLFTGQGPNAAASDFEFPRNPTQTTIYSKSLVQQQRDRTSVVQRQKTTAILLSPKQIQDIFVSDRRGTGKGGQTRSQARKSEQDFKESTFNPFEPEIFSSRDNHKELRQRANNEMIGDTPVKGQNGQGLNSARNLAPQPFKVAEFADMDFDEEKEVKIKQAQDNHPIEADSFERASQSGEHAQFYEGGEEVGKQESKRDNMVGRSGSVLSESPLQIQEPHYEQSRQSVRSSHYKQKGNIRSVGAKKFISGKPNESLQSLPIQGIKEGQSEFQRQKFDQKVRKKKVKSNERKKFSLYQVNNHFPGAFFYLKSDEINVSEKDGFVGADQKLEFDSQVDDFMNQSESANIKNLSKQKINNYLEGRKSQAKKATNEIIQDQLPKKQKFSQDSSVYYESEDVRSSVNFEDEDRWKISVPQETISLIERFKRLEQLIQTKSNMLSGNPFGKKQELNQLNQLSPFSAMNSQGLQVKKNKGSFKQQNAVNQKKQEQSQAPYTSKVNTMDQINHPYEESQENCDTHSNHNKSKERKENLCNIATSPEERNDLCRVPATSVSRGFNNSSASPPIILPICQSVEDKIKQGVNMERDDYLQQSNLPNKTPSKFGSFFDSKIAQILPDLSSLIGRSQEKPLDDRLNQQIDEVEVEFEIGKSQESSTSQKNGNPYKIQKESDVHIKIQNMSLESHSTKKLQDKQGDVFPEAVDNTEPDHNELLLIDELDTARKTIEALTLELAECKERLTIGSQILVQTVKDQTESLRCITKSFEQLLEKYKYKKQRADQKKTKQSHGNHYGGGDEEYSARVTQNVPRKVPKLLKQKEEKANGIIRRFTLREINQGGKPKMESLEKTTPNSKDNQLINLNNNTNGGQNVSQGVVDQQNLNQASLVYESDGTSRPLESELIVSTRQNVQEVQHQEPLTLTDQTKGKSISAGMNYVHPAHPNFNMVFNIMLGIKMSVDATLDIPMFEPTDKDYNIRCQFGVAPYKTNSSDVVKACQFFDYAPKIFASIRKLSGISKKKYLDSLGPDLIFSFIFNGNFQTLAELCSSGKSGSFFYYSHDGQFLLKTIPRKEFKLMKNMLKNYHVYLKDKNPDTFISKVYGLHKVIFYRKKGKTKKKLYFCVMNNVFQTSKKIDLRYDLKGSTYGRQTITDPKGIQVDRTVALKDLDFLNKKEQFKVDSGEKQRILQILLKDCQFFAENGIIDYSLLVGIHNKSEHPITFPTEMQALESPLNNNHNNQQAALNESISNFNTLNNWSRQSSQNLSADWDNMENKTHFCQRYEGGLLSQDSQHIYFIGVIDIFTEFNASKRLENIYKSVFQDAQTVSCVPPQQYADRFYEFMSRAFV